VQKCFHACKRTDASRHYTGFALGIALGGMIHSRSLHVSSLGSHTSLPGPRHTMGVYSHVPAGLQVTVVQG
jgi:hypothetical protein